MRSTRLALGIAALLGLALAPSPLLGVHGAESALVLGLVLPPFTAAIGARLVAAARQHGAGCGAAWLLTTAVGTALWVLAVPVVLLALNALRVRQCEPLLGLAFIALGPGCSVVLSALVGTAIAAAWPRPRLATVAAVLVPLATIGLALYRFWSTPAIAFYGHFFGWFPGTIYDEELQLPAALLSLRAVSLAFMAAAALFVAGTWDRGTARARPALAARRPVTLALALALLLGVAIAEAHGPRLGHWTDASTIAEELGLTHRSERCILHAPRGLRSDQLERLAADCDFRVRQAERMLGVEQREPVRAFFFRNADEKRRHMGAGSTYIAKPWRNEVYLQLRRWPHPVLAHEIAHVVAGRAAPRPWRVSGALGGWLPNPGLIEGAAVAAAWNPHEELTPHQWARAMVELDQMPPLERIIGLSFVLESSRHAYTAAGSFVRFLHEQHGPEAVRRAYRSGDVATAVGEPLDSLEQRWRQFLDGIEMPPEAMDLARLRFEGRRSIFARVCPRRVANLRRELREEVGSRADARVRRTCRRILDIDPGDVGVRARLVGALAREGALQEAQAELERLEGPIEAPAPVRVRARQAIADAAWLRGEPERALQSYRELLQQPQHDDDARTLEVKAIAIEAGGRQEELIRQLLIGRDGRPASGPVVVHLARELGEVREDGLGPYLEARQMHHQERFELALPLLREARRRGLPTERLRFEAKRLEGIALFATGRLDDAEQLWRSIAQAPAQHAGRRARAEDWLARVEFGTRSRAQRQRNH